MILGAYNQQLWYRLDNQQGDNTMADGAIGAWMIAASDVPQLELVRHIGVTGGAPVGAMQLQLPVLPCFQGGFVRVVYESGVWFCDF